MNERRPSMHQGCRPAGGACSRSVAEGVPADRRRTEKTIGAIPVPPAAPVPRPGGGCVDQRTCAAPLFPGRRRPGSGRRWRPRPGRSARCCLVEAAVAGVDPQVVDAAAVAAAGPYLDARVHGVIGVLVERQVRPVLRRTATGPPRDDAVMARSWGVGFRPRHPLVPASPGAPAVRHRRTPSSSCPRRGPPPEPARSRRWGRRPRRRNVASRMSPRTPEHSRVLILQRHRRPGTRGRRP